jgi:hypothetical protein
MGPIMPIFGIRARRAGDGYSLGPAPRPATANALVAKHGRKLKPLYKSQNSAGTPPSSRPRSSTPGLSDTLWLIRSAHRQCGMKNNTRNLEVVRSARGSLQVA